LPGFVHIPDPKQTVREIAHLMSDSDTGAILVGENDRLVGIVTDRDIALRVVAEGRDDDTAVRDVMSRALRYCFDDEDVQHVAENMADLQIRRLPVLNREKRLVGVVSLANIASSQDQRASTTLLRGVAQAH
jgi:CBS domain-containing protein